MTSDGRDSGSSSAAGAEGPHDPAVPAGVRVGFVGLGRLGAPIAHRIVEAGFPLTAWARHRPAVDAFRSTPARCAADLKELGSASDVVCVCVTDAPDVLEVLEGGLLDGMAEGSALIVHSTVRPEACEVIARIAARHDVDVLDAPLCGGPYAAAVGTLPIPVGGGEALFQRLRPLLATYGGVIRHCGPLGSGQRVKLVFNLLYAANVEIIYDAVKVGTACGVDRDVLVEILTGFPYTGFVGGMLATGRAGPDGIGHNRRMLLKDLASMQQLLEAEGVSEGRIGPLARSALDSLRSYL